MTCSCCKEKNGDVLDVMSSGYDSCSCCENTDKIKIIKERSSAVAQIISSFAKSINKIRETVDLRIKKLDERAIIPQYQHEGDAGFDLSAIVEEKDAMGKLVSEKTVSPGEKYIAKTGLAMTIPKGYELQVRPRSGLAYKYGITIINSPGTVDSGYRGEVMVILLNTGENPFVIKNGDRIAQGVINKLPTVTVLEVKDLDETERGAGGFGSTGK